MTRGAITQPELQARRCGKPAFVMDRNRRFKIGIDIEKVENVAANCERIFDELLEKKNPHVFFPERFQKAADLRGVKSAPEVEIIGKERRTVGAEIWIPFALRFALEGVHERWRVLISFAHHPPVERLGAASGISQDQDDFHLAEC